MLSKFGYEIKQDQGYIDRTSAVVWIPSSFKTKIHEVHWNYAQNCHKNCSRNCHLICLRNFPRNFPRNITWQKTQNIWENSKRFDTWPQSYSLVGVSKSSRSKTAQCTFHFMDISFKEGLISAAAILTRIKCTVWTKKTISIRRA